MRFERNVTSETLRHRFSNHSVQIFVLYMPVGPVYTVLRRAMISHLVGALEPEHFAGSGDGHAQLFDDRLDLTSPQELKINYSLRVCASQVRLGMTGFSKVLTFYMQLRQH